MTYDELISAAENAETFAALCRKQAGEMSWPVEGWPKDGETYYALNSYLGGVYSDEFATGYPCDEHRLRIGAMWRTEHEAEEALSDVVEFLKARRDGK